MTFSLSGWNLRGRSERGGRLTPAVQNDTQCGTPRYATLLKNDAWLRAEQSSPVQHEFDTGAKTPQRSPHVQGTDWTLAGLGSNTSVVQVLAHHSRFLVILDLLLLGLSEIAFRFI